MNHRLLFTDVLEGKAEMRGAELRNSIIERGRLTSFTYYNKLLARALKDGIIRKWEKGGYVYYRLDGGPL